MSGYLVFDQHMLSLDSLVETGFDIIDESDFTDSIDENVFLPDISEDVRWKQLSPTAQFELISAQLSSIDDALLKAFRLQYYVQRPSWVSELLNLSK